MNPETLKTVYSRDSWRLLLNDLFGTNFKPFSKFDDLQVENQTAKAAVQLGEITLASGDVLAVYEVQLQEHIQVERNKVAIRNLLRTHWNNYDGAFIASYKTSEVVWRFSFVSETRQYDTDGNYGKVVTAAKRYTYVLGKNESVRTATERFKKLGEIGKNATLEDIKTTFSVEALTKDFYKELFAWYQWALSDDEGFAVTYPNDTSTDADDRKIEEHLIRLITRLMFVWFIKQKKLVPDQIFKIEDLKCILSDFEPHSITKGNYYNAILQNLFFATLNKKISEREFAKNGSFNEQKEHFGIKTLFRDTNEKSWFKQSHNEIIDLFNEVPFMNGGLFECLDKTEDGKILYYDGFSRAAGRQKRAFLPNRLFFDVDKGIIPLLEKYNFTVEENTPEDVEVALDPELLGKVFENLLGAYNPETKETARKQSGSFYTPREIVNYMVDESIIAYLKNTCNDIPEENIRTLFRMDILPEDIPFSNESKDRLIAALKAVKMLDPACGSGAFPMGMLNRMLDLLHKLSPGDTSKYQTKLHLIENCIYGVDIQTIAVQISKLRFFISLICEQEKDATQENYGIIALPNLETKFVAANTLIGLKKDFSDKLDLQNDELNALKIQLLDVRHKHFLAPSAFEKHKLRALDKDLRKRIKTFLIDNSTKPNTEKIKLFRARIAALEKEKKQYAGEKWEDSTLAPQQQATIDFGFEPIPKEQPAIFRVDVNKQKRNEIDTQIKRLESEIIREECKSKNDAFEDEAEKLAHWNPYDQNTSSLFFDAEWMFGVSGGFDLVVGNPPYINIKNQDEFTKSILSNFNYSKGADIYVGFIEKGYDLLKPKASLCYIIPNKFFGASYGKLIREHIRIDKNIISIWDLKDVIVFESASITTVVLLSSNEVQDNQKTLIKLNDSFNLVESIFDKNGKIQLESSDNEKVFLNKIASNCFQLNEIADVRTGIMGFEYWKMMDIIRSNGAIENDNVPIYTNGNLQKYRDNWESCEITLYKSKYQSPTIQLNPNFLNNNTIELFKTKPKIIVRGVSKEVAAIIDYKGAGLLVAVHSICPKKIEIRTLLGIINSMFVNWYHLKTFYSQRIPQGSLKYPIEFFNSVPIPKIANNVKISNFVSILNEIHYNKIEDNKDEICQKIDELVFKLYDLTYEEVLVVCPDFWLSEEEYEAVEM